MRSVRGFSLLEVIIATSILTVALSALAALCATAVRANAVAGSTSVAAILAAAKMEQLHAIAWDALAPSAGDALVQDVGGYCDFLDGKGRVLAADALSPGTVYVRRWSVTPLPATPASAVVVQVRVTRAGRASDAPLARAPGPGEARLFSVRTRKAE